MNTIILTDISQGTSLDPDAMFDLILGYVGPDSRSVANLRDAQSHSALMWVFTSVDCTILTQSTELMYRKIRRNLSGFHGAINKVYSPEVEKELHTELLNLGDGAKLVKLLIDVSAFPRRVLASLLNIVRKVVSDGVAIKLTICYRLAIFSKPSDQAAPPNKRVAPVHSDLAGWPRMPGLPVHLIVGLGYEQGKALGAVEYIQPSYLWLFNPQSPEPRFAEQVFERNRPLLEGVDSFAIFDYQVLEPSAQIAQLSSMLARLVHSRRPVLLPFGPKIFFAICVLVSFGFPEVSVWHVSGEEQDGVANLKPSLNAAYMTLTLSQPDEASTPVSH